MRTTRAGRRRLFRCGERAAVQLSRNARFLAAWNRAPRSDAVDNSHAVGGQRRDGAVGRYEADRSYLTLGVDVERRGSRCHCCSAS